MGTKQTTYWQDQAHHTGDVVPFLIHSLTHHYELIESIITFVKPQNVLEIGSEAGGSSMQLAELSQKLDYQLTTIDPQPDKKIVALAAKHKNYRVIAGKSLDHIHKLSFFPEVAIIDGDHNYYTVFHELSQLLEKHRDEAFAIILHDVGFPSGRRDMYYHPADIPKGFLHAHSFHNGALPGEKRLVKNAGFSGAGKVAFAREEGGPKNGVLTAVEDMLTAHPHLKYQQVEAVFGLGVIYSGPRSFREAIETRIAPYQKQILANLERNRIASYLRLVELEKANTQLHQENIEREKELQLKRSELATTQRELEILRASDLRRERGLLRRLARRLGLV